MTNRINKSEIVRAIEESGYLIEQRVESILNTFDYYVSPNSSYIDDETGKTREIDLAAISLQFVLNTGHAIFPFLIIECENNKQPIVFFRHKSDLEGLNYEEVKVSGCPINFFKNGKGDASQKKLIELLNFAKFHHYCKGITSTQYCSFQLIEKRGEKKWLALHNEEQHNSFQNIIKCLKYRIDEHFSFCQPISNKKKQRASIQVYYPLLVLQGDLYEANLENGEIELIPRKHIQYRKQTANSSKIETFQIDVISEDYLSDYLRLVEKEVKEIVKKLSGKTKLIEENLNIYHEKLKKAKDTSEYKSILQS